MDVMPRRDTRRGFAGIRQIRAMVSRTHTMLGSRTAKGRDLPRVPDKIVFLTFSDGAKRACA